MIARLLREGRRALCSGEIRIMGDRDRPDDDSTDLWSREELVIESFEEEWRNGKRPVIEAFLPANRKERRRVLIELVHIELEWRLKSGEPARVEEYLGRFPELARVPRVVLRLIEAECRQRRRRGDRAPTEDYVRRFPQDAVRLRSVLDEVQSAAATPPGMSSTAPPSPEGSPSRGVPGYEILDELGRGQMGVVYKARHLRRGTFVAIKMILAGEHAGAEQLARFRTEAEVLATLRHPNIIEIFEVGQHECWPFLVIELVEGGSLQKKLERSRLAQSEAVGLVHTLAQAIHWAHRHKIIHRDLKPGNVLLAPDGQPKITDFGLAKRLDQDLGISGSWAIVGTAAYMAPEQAKGRVKQLGPAADVYGLGAILYELLTGRPPFWGTTVFDVLEQVRFQDPVEPRKLEPAIPPALEAICLHCLAKSPKKRYASAEALAQDLDRFLNGEQVLAGRGPPILPAGSASEDPAFHDVMSRLQQGDQHAATEVFHRFAHRLIGLARSHLDQRIRHKVDPEDVMQSALKSFFARHADGQFDLSSWDNLWTMLVVITLRKCGQQTEHYRAGMRDVGREERAVPLASKDSVASWAFVAGDPTPEQAAMLAEAVEEVLRSLGDDRERQILELALQGLPTVEISNRVKRSERTVQRVLDLVRRRLGRLRSE
jgi:serine/threonine protein kinase